MMRKAQAAMEFLMSYGWALLVVMAAIGALAYFGVLSPEKYIPESCVLEQGVGCADFKVTQTDVTLYLQNGMGKHLDISTIDIGECSEDIDERLLNTEFLVVEIPCETGEEGDVFKQRITIHYTVAGSELTKEHRGDIIARVPPE